MRATSLLVLDGVLAARLGMAGGREGDVGGAGLEEGGGAEVEIGGAGGLWRLVMLRYLLWNRWRCSCPGRFQCGQLKPMQGEKDSVEPCRRRSHYGGPMS